MSMEPAMKSNLPLFGFLVITVTAAIAVENHWERSRMADLKRELEAIRDARVDPLAHPRAPTFATRAVSPALYPAPLREAAPTPLSHGDAVEPAETRAARRARWKEAERAHEAAVEAGFAAETVDRSWAGDARQDLRSRVAAVLPSPASLRDVDCRSTMCRVEMVCADTTELRSFFDNAFLRTKDRVWNGATFAMPPQPNPDGSLGVVLYLAREGTSLPTAD
jgi:hypothetical protein